MKRAEIRKARPPAPSKVTMCATVTQMLIQSMQFHRRAASLRVPAHERFGPVIHPTAQAKAEARDLIVQAAVLRRDAHLMDPNHECPAWMEEQTKTPEGRDTHRELMDFYRSQGVL